MQDRLGAMEVPSARSGKNSRDLLVRTASLGATVIPASAATC